MFPFPRLYVFSCSGFGARRFQIIALVSMQQVKDIEALICGGGADTKVACEIQLTAAEPSPNVDHDLPPDSIMVRIGSGRDPFWAVALGGTVYERDDSTKGSTNPKAQAQQHQHTNPISKHRSNSHRFSGVLQPNPSTIGIPGKNQHHSGHLARSGRRPANARIFPKKTPRPGDETGRKSAVPFEDPGSPKVSCIGKVLSQRERDRCRRKRVQLLEEGKEVGVESVGCWGSLSAVICCGRRHRPTGSPTAETSPGIERAIAAVEKKRAVEPSMEAPGLGELKRFSSGRRAASWGGNGDEDRGMGVGAFDREEAFWGSRRSVGSLEEAERERETGSDSV